MWASLVDRQTHKRSDISIDADKQTDIYKHNIYKHNKTTVD